MASWWPTITFLYVELLASCLTCTSLPWFPYPKSKPVNLNANYYSLAILQESDIGRPCVKPLPYVISLNPGNSMEREVGSTILWCQFASWAWGPGQCPPIYLSSSLRSMGHTSLLNSIPTLLVPQHFYVPTSYFFRASSIIMLHISQYVLVMIPDIPKYIPESLCFIYLKHWISDRELFC